jgi:Protein of unknown function (DUF3025)
MMQAWDPRFYERSPMFDPLRGIAENLRSVGWPGPAELNQLLEPAPVVTSSGCRLRFVPQEPKVREFAQRYEPRIYLKGEVQVRAETWHDLFNALVWLTFPRAKAELNARHYAALRETTGKGPRGPVQDALTLFDEGGVIVASGSRRLLHLLETFKWKELFWANRNEVRANMRFYLFGHALYEKALAPFIGVSGRGILFEVAPSFLHAQLEEQLSGLDAMLAAYISDVGNLTSTRALAPVPVLGVPGWARDNENPSYYDNELYFRAGRAKHSGT